MHRQDYNGLRKERIPRPACPGFGLAASPPPRARSAVDESPYPFHSKSAVVHPNTTTDADGYGCPAKPAQPSIRTRPQSAVVFTSAQQRMEKGTDTAPSFAWLWLGGVATLRARSAVDESPYPFLSKSVVVFTNTTADADGYGCPAKQSQPSIRTRPQSAVVFTQHYNGWGKERLLRPARQRLA